MDWWILYSIIAAVVAALVAGYYFLKRKMGKRMTEQKELVDKHKITASILVLEKRMGRIGDANVPKEIIAQIPKIYKYKKSPIVKAKVGPRVIDLLCEKEVFDKLPDKKSVTVELAGIFIAGISKGASAHKGRR